MGSAAPGKTDVADSGALTAPGLRSWSPPGGRFTAWQKTALIGTLDDWERITGGLSRWEIKTRSGFRVRPAVEVEAGQRPLILVTLAGLRIREPVEVVQVVCETDRVGFSYRALEGHPIRGEEAFIAQLTPRGVELTLRSLTRRAPRGIWRILFPGLLVAQRVARWRYFRALRY